MDGAWDADQLDNFFAHLLRAHPDRAVKPLNLVLAILRDRLSNHQKTRRAWQVGKVHYDLGNDFYQAMLGPVMPTVAVIGKPPPRLRKRRRPS